MMTVIANFAAAFGPIAYVLLLASVIILAISIERLIALFIQPVVPGRQLNHLSTLLRQGQIGQIKKLIKSVAPFLHESVTILLTRRKNAAEEELSLMLAEIRNKLQQPLEWLNFFAIVSPMLGLLGTIWSMSHSFHELGSSLTAGGMQRMISYLSEAMYATAFGIVLSLFSMLALYIFKYRSENCINRCEHFLNRMLFAIHHSQSGDEHD